MEFTVFFGTMAGLATMLIISAVVSAIRENDEREKRNNDNRESDREGY